MNPIAERIKSARERTELKVPGAAAKTQTISKRMWYRFEQGVSRPGVDEIREIADVLGCSTDYLLGRTQAIGTLQDTGSVAVQAC